MLRLRQMDIDRMDEVISLHWPLCLESHLDYFGYPYRSSIYSHNPGYGWYFRCPRGIEATSCSQERKKKANSSRKLAISGAHRPCSE